MNYMRTWPLRLERADKFEHRIAEGVEGRPESSGEAS